METSGVGGKCHAFHLGHFDFVGPWGIQMKIEKARAQKTGLDGGKS